MGPHLCNLHGEPRLGRAQGHGPRPSTHRSASPGPCLLLCTSTPSALPPCPRDQTHRVQHVGKCSHFSYHEQTPTTVLSQRLKIWTTYSGKWQGGHRDAGIPGGLRAPGRPGGPDLHCSCQGPGGAAQLRPLLRATASPTKKPHPHPIITSHTSHRQGVPSTTSQGLPRGSLRKWGPLN